MDLSNKKTKFTLALIIIILLLTFFVFLSFFIKNKVEQKKMQNTSSQNLSKEDQIKKKIGDFSIEEEQAYKGGTIIKAIAKKGDMSQRAILFFQDGKLQKLPDEYVTDLVKSQIFDSKEKENIVAAKYQEEYNFGNKDADGKDIAYNNIYLITNELPESDWVKNAMYPEGPAKYQVFVIDEFGQTQFKFLSSNVL